MWEHGETCGYQSRKFLYTLESQGLIGSKGWSNGFSTCTPELPARLRAVDAFLGDAGRDGGAAEAEAALSAAVEAGTHLFLEKVSP